MININGYIKNIENKAITACTSPFIVKIIHHIYQEDLINLRVRYFGRYFSSTILERTFYGKSDQHILEVEMPITPFIERDEFIHIRIIYVASKIFSYWLKYAGSIKIINFKKIK